MFSFVYFGQSDPGVWPSFSCKIYLFCCTACHDLLPLSSACTGMFSANWPAPVQVECCLRSAYWRLCEETGESGVFPMSGGRQKFFVLFCFFQWFQVSVCKKLAIKIGPALAGLKIKINHSIHSTFLLQVPIASNSGEEFAKETTSHIT